MQRVWQFVLIAALAWVPVITLGVLAMNWQNPRTDVPSHWDFAGTPDTMPSSLLLATALIPSAICAVVATVAALFLDANIGKWAAASGFGILVAVGAAVGLQWPVAQLTAADTALQNRIGSPFLLYLLAIAWGGLAFGVAATRHIPNKPDQGSEPNEHTDANVS